LEEAAVEVRDILKLYQRVYEELLAVPVIPGQKTEKEKFAGGYYTTTVEGFVPASGRGIQGGTSHCLGQNFSKMFDIVVEDPKNVSEKIHVWQNSWGLSTRAIGVMVMIHGDDKGLIFPPRVAQYQVVIIPTGLTAKSSDDQRKEVMDEAAKIAKVLVNVKVRAKVDLRTGYTPGFKFSDWEMKGVPLRLEVGPKDLAAKSVLSVRRDDGTKAPIALDSISKDIPRLLEDIQSSLYSKALESYNSRIRIIRNWKDFVPAINNRCICVIPWCENESCEDGIKDRSAKESAEAVQDDRAPSAGAKSLCIPFDQDRFGPLGDGAVCTGCRKPAKCWTMFGRSY